MVKVALLSFAVEGIKFQGGGVQIATVHGTFVDSKVVETESLIKSGMLELLWKEVVLIIYLEILMQAQLTLLSSQPYN